MELTYETMKAFMERYCKEYSLYANDAETMPKMDEFWAVDFVSTAYFHVQGKEYPLLHQGRNVFQQFLIDGHVNIKDSLVPRSVIIDDKQKKAVVMLKIVKQERNTKEIFEIDGIGCYQLVLDENNTIKIKSLDFFWNAPERIKKEYSRKTPTLVTGVIGEDVHITGIRILEHALRSAGFKVVSLGIHNSQEDFINAAIETNADAILISSLCGHASMLVQGFKEKCLKAGIQNTLLYLGGQLVIHEMKWEEVERMFKEMGFDRVYEPFVLPEPVIESLKHDLALKGSR